MPSETAIMRAVESSNAPAGVKQSLLRHYAEKAGFFGGGALARVKAHAQGSASVLRQGGESAIVGVALGALDCELPTGLDVHVGNSATGIPVDALVAAAGLGGSVLWAHEGMSEDLRNAGAAALSVFAYRKTHAFMASRAVAKGVMPGSAVAAQAAATTPAAQQAAVAGEGGFGVDPIVALAQRL